MFAHQIGVLLYGFAKRTKNNPRLGKRFAERGFDRHGIHNGIHRHARQHFLFVKRDTEFVEGCAQIRVYLVERLLQGDWLWGGVVDNVLKINRLYIEVRPRWHSHFLPFAKGIEAKLQQPRWFVFFGRNGANGIFGQSFGNKIVIHFGFKTILVVRLHYIS